MLDREPEFIFFCQSNFLFQVFFSPRGFSPPRSLPEVHCSWVLGSGQIFGLTSHRSPGFTMGGDPNAAMNAQMQAQLQQAQMAQRQAQIQAQQRAQSGQLGGMPSGPNMMPGVMPHVVMLPGQPIAANAHNQHEMTLAQIAAQQNAEATGGKEQTKTKALKKIPKKQQAQIEKAAAAAQQQQQQQQPAQQQPHPPQTAANIQKRAQNLPLRQQNPADIVNALKTNLDMIRREFAENLSAAATRGEEYQPPSFQIRSQHDAAVGIELWLMDHRANFNAEELGKKVTMLRNIQTKCRLGRLDPTSTQNKIEALACWVELTKTYYICARESRNLKLRGVQGITSPTFRLPDTTKQIPPPRPPEDFTSVAELDVTMGQVVGAQKWVEAVERAMTAR